MKTLKSIAFACGILLAGLGMLGTPGCSSGGKDVPPQLHAVSGVVTIDGKNLAGVRLSFIPQQGTKGLGGYAVTDATGAFTAMHMSGSAGLESGTYQVTFSRLAMPDGSPIPEGKDAADVGAVESLPAKLTQSQTDGSGTTTTIDKPTAELKFELKTK